MEGIFAATPPREALRYLVHRAATISDGGRGGDKVMMINDVAGRALRPKLQEMCAWNCQKKT